MTEEKVTPSTKKRYPEVTIPVKAAYLHKAIMLAGQTESTLIPSKVRGIALMGWTSTGAFMIEAKNGETHLLPSAAVADTILE